MPTRGAGGSSALDYGGRRGPICARVLNPRDGIVRSWRSPGPARGRAKCACRLCIQEVAASCLLPVVLLVLETELASPLSSLFFACKAGMVTWSVGGLGRAPEMSKPMIQANTRGAVTYMPDTKAGP